MNARSLRRLAADHASLHTHGLPPNYLFPPSHPSNTSTDDLSQLTLLLAGPEGTPYAPGIWKIHLDIPPTYPTAPPTAFFRTRIWHPNVDEATGAICVETLKRDWTPSLTLRDVLVTISCLLIQPNPASALNGEAGRLMEEDYAAFARRAKLMAGIHAAVPGEMRGSVEEAKRRGEAEQGEKGEERGKKRKAKAVSRLVEEEENATQVPASSSSVNIAASRRQGTRSDPFGTTSDNIFGIRSTAAPSADAPATTEIDAPATPAQRKTAVSKGPHPPASSSKNTSYPILGPIPALPTTPLRAIPSSHRSPFRTPAPPTALAAPDSSASSSWIHQTPTRPTKQMRISPPSPEKATPSRPSRSAKSGLAQPIQRTSSATPAVTDDAPAPWLRWYVRLPVDKTPERAKREKAEGERLKAAGGCLRRYNTGRFGVRRGILRL